MDKFSDFLRRVSRRLRKETFMIPAASTLRLIVIAVTILLAACGSPQEREAAHLQNGKALYANGDLVKAMLEFRNALQINPTGTEARYYVGLILERQGNFPAAISAFQEVSMQDPGNRDAHLKLGQHALLGANPERALLHADKLIALSPSDADGHTMRAAALLMDGKLAEADMEATAALALKPNDPDALAVLASQRARQKQFDQALTLIDGGLLTAPASIPLWSMRLALLRDQGNEAGVTDTLRKLIEIAPDNPRFVLDLAKSLDSDGKTSEAQHVFVDAIHKSKSPDSLIEAYAAFLERTVGAEKAIDATKAAIAAAPGNRTYDLLLARLHMKAGQLDEAEQLLDSLIDRSPNLTDQLEIRVELAHVAQMRGNTEDALSQLAAILKEDSGNRNALLLRATIQFTQAKYDSTIADARSVLSAEPTSSIALGLLAQSYLAANERELAVATLRTLVNVAPDSVDAHVKLAGLLASKSPDEAVQHLDAALLLRPDMTDLQLSKAQILTYSRHGDKGEVIGRSLLADSNTAAIGHQILGEAALARQDYQSAVRELKAALDLGRDFAIIGPTLIDAQRRAGSGGDVDTAGNDAAETLLAGRITKTPQDADALILLADLRQRDGDIDTAEDLLRRAIAAAPHNRAAYLHLSLILKQRGDKVGTLGLLRKTAQIFPNDSLVAESLAIAQELAGDFEGARTSYEAILARWPGNIVASNNLALLIADIWPTDKVLLDRARLLVEVFRDSNNATLIDTLGWVQLRLDNIDDATILLEKATSLTPKDQQMLYHYAVALSRKKLNERARLVLGNALAGQPDFRGLDDAKVLSAGLARN
ncbi:tetratricopeptide repeat protein [Dongia sp.]|uniref:tetratricopeptide repeat protein n=1 Tax=Dongia sp. TaxID=1977262 RepID=UPI0035B2D23E